MTYNAPSEVLAEVERLTRDGFTVITAPGDTGGGNYVGTLRRDNLIASVAIDGTITARIIGTTDLADDYADGRINADDYERPVITIDGTVYALKWQA